MSRVGILAGGLLVAGLLLPWGTLSVGLLGSPTVRVGTVNGQQIGSDILSVPVGWIAAGAGVLGIIGSPDAPRGPFGLRG